MDDLAALRLQIAWGADEALEEAPVNRLRTAPPPPLQPTRVRQTEAGTSHSGAAAPDPAHTRERVVVGMVPPPASLAERALRSATAAMTLEELRAALAAFDGCALRDTASHLVFADGDPSSALLLIGEPPDATEDRSGTPFAGPAGAYLDRMLAAIGLNRTNLLLTPLIPWRPPGDRPPSTTELALCLPFLHRLIAIAKPSRLLLLGPLAARSVLPQSASRRRARGAWIDAPIPGTPNEVPALPTFGPAELMRNPKDRRAAWADLRLLRRTLDADAKGEAS